MPQLLRQKDPEKLHGTDMINNMEIVFHMGLKGQLPCTANRARGAGSSGAILRPSWWARQDPPVILLTLETASPSLKHLHPFRGSAHCTRGLGQADHGPRTRLAVSLLLNPRSVPGLSLRDLAAAFRTLSPPGNADCHLVSRRSHFLVPFTV